MRTYIIRRLAQMVPVFLGIMLILFLLLQLAPGGPTGMLMDPRMSAEQKQELAEKYGENKPFYEKFISWMADAAKGNFGNSITHKKPVVEVIKDFIGNTFLLAIVSLLVGLFIGVPIGIVSATKQYSAVDYGTTIFSLIGVSLPAFFFGLLLLKIFAVELPWFPIFGLTNPLLRKADWIVRAIDKAHHLVLPVTVLGLTQAASFMRYTRSSMLEVIRQDYVRTARAKGLRDKVVIYKHAFRNAMIPIITLLGFSIPGLISGALMTETIFSLPGLGKISVEAVGQRNYPLILGINAMLSIVTLLSALIADLLYATADPRIRYD
ncbi:MAG TPA: ABC transporter permease [Bacillota bacterium]|nr:ABC transporter permease [Bacillota bacterium]